MKRFLLLFSLLACLMCVPMYESLAQCPPPLQCDPPPGENPTPPDGETYQDCYSVVTQQGYNEDGSTWMRICTFCVVCHETTIFNNETGQYEEGALDCGVSLPEVVSCYYINRQY